MKILLVRDFDNFSLSMQADLLERGLKELGYKVDTRDKRVIGRDLIPDGYDIYIYYYPFNSYLSVTGIPKRNKSIVVMLSEGDAIGHPALKWFNTNPVDAIVTPSRWSANGITKLGSVLQPIFVIPNALPDVNPTISDIPHPTVFVDIPHSWDRKGGDIAQYALSVTKNYILVDKYMEKEKFYSYFISSDILLHPARGGSFENPIIEALSFGLDVVIPEQGPWTEYVDPSHAYWIKVNGKIKVWYHDVVQVGMFLNVDKEDAKSKLMLALSNWSMDRKLYRLKNIAPIYKEKFNYKRIAKLFSEVFYEI